MGKNETNVNEQQLDKVQVELSDREVAAERRNLRRKRRVRNQIMAYVTLVLVVVMVASGGYITWTHFGTAPEQPPVEEVQSSVMQSQVEDLINQEPEITKPEPTVEPEPEPTPAERLDEIVNAAIAAMPLEDKIAGLFIVTPEAITGVKTAVKAGESTKTALAEHPVGGLIYFEKNIKDSDQLLEMISNTNLYSKYPLFLAMDEEGGSVSRLAKKKLVDNVGKAADIGATGDAANAYAASEAIAGYMTKYGFNLNFAPVADVKSVEDSVIGDRAYGEDPALVGSMVASAVLGLENNGVSACLKHFPGIGSTTEDTHKVQAVTNRTADEFRELDFMAFQAGIESGVDFVMISHVAAPELTENGNEPCIFSKKVVTDLLRNELGFEGVVITDAMNMKAISEYYASADAAIWAIKAGCDMLLMPEDYKEAYDGVLQAVKDEVISEERINDALRRIYRIKYAHMVADSNEIAAVNEPVVVAETQEGIEEQPPKQPQKQTKERTKEQTKEQTEEQTEENTDMYY